MPPPIRLSPGQYGQIGNILAEDGARIKQIETALDSLPRETFSAKELSTALCKVLPKGSARALARLLIVLGTYCRRHGVETEAAVGAFDRGLTFSNWTDEQKSIWEHQLKSALTRLVNAEGVHILSKVIDLAIENANTFDTSAVISDIRPILDDDRDGIIGALVSQTLSIAFFDAVGIAIT